MRWQGPSTFRDHEDAKCGERPVQLLAWIQMIMLEQPGLPTFWLVLCVRDIHFYFHKPFVCVYVCVCVCRGKSMYLFHAAKLDSMALGGVYICFVLFHWQRMIQRLSNWLCFPLLCVRRAQVYQMLTGLPRWLSGKESACQCRRRRR